MFCNITTAVVVVSAAGLNLVEEISTVEAFFIFIFLYISFIFINIKFLYIVKNSQ